MARSSGTRLTKYVSASTIVTADVANSWYGGLYGTTEGDAYQEGDPVIAGHVHDGQHKDGHAQKINLVDHVTGQLRNSNLADDAVTKRNVQSFLDQGAAIPVSEVVDGYTYYYLDLSSITPSPFVEDGGVISNKPSNLETDDFVFGSDSLDDDGDITHDSRFLFDKSKGAFRAGTAQSTTWDEVNRGNNSVAFGLDNTSSGNLSSVLGGETNTNSSSKAAIVSGQNNTASGSIAVIIGAGNTNSIVDSNNSGIFSGQSNTISESESAIIGGGFSSQISNKSDYSAIGAGQECEITSSAYSFIGSARTSTIDGGGHTVILSGRDQDATDSGYTAILSGRNHTTTNAIYSGIVSGYQNSIDNGYYNSIVGGISGTISSATAGFIGGGGKNKTDTTIGNSITDGKSSAILSGYGNTISSSGVGNSILGGYSNTVGGTSEISFISGADNTITSATASSILGGTNNEILADFSSILNGNFNTVSSTASYSLSSGYHSKSRSYGERVHASGQFSTIDGSAQDFSLIFRKEIAAGGVATTFNLKLNGTSENAYLENGSILYFTAELLMVDTAGSARYGRKRTFLIDNASGTININNGSYTDELDPDTDGSWIISVIDFGSGEWFIQLGHSAPGTTRYAMCICRGSMVKYK